MRKWEYKVLYYTRVVLFKEVSLIETLNNLGDEGWELISSIPIVEGKGSEGDVHVWMDEIKFIFKREKSDATA